MTKGVGSSLYITTRGRLGGNFNVEVEHLSRPSGPANSEKFNHDKLRGHGTKTSLSHEPVACTMALGIERDFMPTPAVTLRELELGQDHVTDT